MNPPESKDPLDAWLREEDRYIDDHGFTQRVLTSLPRRRRSRVRTLSLLGVTFVGMALAAWSLPWGQLLLPDPTALRSLDFQTLLPWLSMLMVGASLIWASIAALESEN